MRGVKQDAGDAQQRRDAPIFDGGFIDIRWEEYDIVRLQQRIGSLAAQNLLQVKCDYRAGCSRGANESQVFKSTLPSRTAAQRGQLHQGQSRVLLHRNRTLSLERSQ